ncbi:DUF6968 family protein [Dyella lipolytica]|uniref:DUF6968 domain-containing protein n=1 Tax=Dyella lipolytica TaxID=1867835 RepID=A0ABW8J1C2_9GAMM|nr:hypothetical protein [Dyella lipolytica]
MNGPKIIDPIAQRKLTFGRSSIIVQIGRPEISEDDFMCAYSISSGGQEKLGHAMGMDSVQALQLALVSIEIDLKALARSSGQEITWLEDTPGNTGFSALNLGGN